MKEFGKLALMINPSLRKYIAQQFIKDSSTRHCIAFFQWRKILSSNKKSKQDIDEIIDNRFGSLAFKSYQSGEQLTEYKQIKTDIYKKQSKFELDFKKIQE